MVNIVFDIDDTVTNETEFMLKYAPTFLKKKYNFDVKIINQHGYNIGEVFNIKDILENQELKEDELEKKIKSITDSFWNENFMKYIFYPIRKDAAQTINELKSKGYKINFVSLRGKKTTDNMKLIDKIIRTKIVPLLTKIQLKINGIKYDNLFLVEKNEEKQEIIESLNAKIVFDDNVTVLENVRYAVPICIKTQHNEFFRFENPNVIKTDFDKNQMLELVESNIVKKEPERKLNKIKNLKMYQKVSTETFYKIVRTIGKNQVLKTFKPLVIGQENLPKIKGANVFVGNHRNIKDPIITISLLENPTHFAALKRMFEYNENMFGDVGKNIGTFLTTLFVKSMGCLPIARKGDNDYILTNVQTFYTIKQYLEMDSSVAIYPEGTLNRNPNDNQNILDLKSNESFKIAEKGKAIIRPVAIVWVPKDVDIENRVLISFLKPIYTNGLSANEISERWKNSMNEAINSMNKIICELEKIDKIEDSKENIKVKILSEKIKHL